MNYREEFPDYDPTTLPEIPAEWTDTSWRNDLCPSWDTGHGLRVLVDWADPDRRELEGPRFLIDSMGNGPVLETDDWQEVLAFVVQHPAGADPFVYRAVQPQSDEQ